jgi:hypothetical protein
MVTTIIIDFFDELPKSHEVARICSQPPRSDYAQNRLSTPRAKDVIFETSFISHFENFCAIHQDLIHPYFNPVSNIN